MAGEEAEHVPYVLSPMHFGITWQDKVPNRVVLDRAGIFSMYTLLKQRCLRWLGHFMRMADGRIPKDLLYSCLLYTSPSPRD